jgi:hypothetical protein
VAVVPRNRLPSSHKDQISLVLLLISNLPTHSLITIPITDIKIKLRKPNILIPRSHDRMGCISSKPAGKYTIQGEGSHLRAHHKATDPKYQPPTSSKQPATQKASAGAQGSATAPSAKTAYENQQAQARDRVEESTAG